MRILAIGDPHGDLEAVRKISLEGADLILLTGDLGSASLARKMAFADAERRKQRLPKLEHSKKERKTAFMESYGSTIRLVRHLAQYAPVYTIYGNVESNNADTRKQSRKFGIKLPFLTDALQRIKGVRIINNRIANFNGIRIGGLEYFIDSSWVREFKPRDYAEKLKEAKKESDKALAVLRNFGAVDILLCHQPPYRVLDEVSSEFAPKFWLGKHAGSKVILDYVTRKQPRYVLCGHMHEDEGHERIGKSEVYNLGVAGYKVIEIRAK